MVPLSWLISERGRLGTVELADFEKRQLSWLISERGRLGTVGLADFGKGQAW